MSTIMATKRRSPISARVNVPQLRERLEILFRTARAPKIDTVSQLDRTLGLEGQRSFRQYYRGDRPSGIPGSLVPPFLNLFNLSLEELLRPLDEFRGLMEAAALGHTGGWQGIEAQRPSLEVTPTGEVRLSWPAWELQLALIPSSPAKPLALGRGGAHTDATGSLRLLGGIPFHIELRHDADAHPRILGLLEARELTCLFEPAKVADGKLRQRSELRALEPGRASLVVLLLGHPDLEESDLRRLHAVDSRTRRLGAEKIYEAARLQDAEAIAVLRADIEVEG